MSDDDPSPEQIIDMAARMKKPVIFNYLVGPHVPDDQETLLSTKGEPIMLSYSDLPWKKLADNLQRQIQATGVPKSIKVYVGNDALDLFDLNCFCVRTNQAVDSYSPFQSADRCFSTLKIADFRAGITQISKELHLNPSMMGKRPPPAAFFISIRLANIDQLVDYLSNVTETLIGLPDFPSPSMSSDKVVGTCDIPSVLKDWLRDDVGIEYADQCTVVRLPVTFSEA